MWSQNRVYDVLEKLSGESIPRQYESLETLEQRIIDADAKGESDPNDFMTLLSKVSSQYEISWGIRGDNTPEYAKYLGYLTSKELYPDMTFTKFEDYLQEVLDGKAETVYEQLRAVFALAFKK